MKKQSNFSFLKFFTIIIPLLVLFGTLILVISFVVFKDNSQYTLKPIITDGKFNYNEKAAYFNGRPIIAPSKPYAIPQEIAGLKDVLAAVKDDTKWIEIDLGSQRLRAWHGNKLVYEFFISTGKRQWGASTPVGVYRIWIKLRSTKMEGGSGSTYYYLPNVQCTQYFYKGFGIHGTYWHDNFGHPMSHGCVNMRTEDACTLFYWSSPLISGDRYLVRPTKDDPGTRVVVHGETPWE